MTDKSTPEDRNPNPEDFVEAEPSSEIFSAENSLVDDIETESMDAIPETVEEIPVQESPSEDIPAPNPTQENYEEIPIGEIHRGQQPPPRRQPIRESISEQLQEFTPELIRQERTGRLAVFPMALGLIVLGFLMAGSRLNWVEGFIISTPNAIVIFLGAVTLTFIFRFFLSGRRERGLFFIALVLIVWGVVLAMTTLSGDNFPIKEYYPLFLGGIGIAFFFTFLFERTHQIGLVLPGVILIFASGVALAVTRNLISEDLQQWITDYSPLLLTLIGLTLLPLVLRRTKRNAQNR